MSNPFSQTGQELIRLERMINEKPNQHELAQVNLNVGSLECTIGQLRTEIDGLRARVQELEAKEISE